MANVLAPHCVAAHAPPSLLYPTRRFPKPPFTVKRFLFYGDSTVKNSWELLMFMARRMCKVEWQPRLLHELFDPTVCPPVSDLKMVDPELSTVLKRWGGDGAVRWTQRQRSGGCMVGVACQ